MKTEVRGRRRGDALRAILAGIATAGVVLVAGVIVTPAPASAEDSSAVTVKARDQDPDADGSPFPDLEVTVSPTTDLADQGLAISWKGGERSAFPTSENAGTNFLQIMQCGGDVTAADGTVGPDRTTCQYGATVTAGNARDNYRPAGVAPAEDLPFTAVGVGPFGSDYSSIPFKSSTGKTIATVVDGVQVPGDVNTNEFFTRFTTNEIPWAGSGADGTGSLSFELQTALRSPGLGCGKVTDGQPQSCWLVVVPRGTNDIGEQSNIYSGLFWDTWKHKVAVKLDFRPLGSQCELGAAERLIVGSELLVHAISSWQPSLCQGEAGSNYSLIVGTESDALLASNLSNAPAPLALTSRSFGDANADRLQYAPVALAGVAVSFAIDRAPLTDAPADAASRARLPLDDLRLTPRLIAKLLTYSYRDSLPQGADRSHIGYVDSSNPGKNARNVTRDPDFLDVNAEEWDYQGINSAALADLLIPQGRSDAAWALWQYVLADDEARRFLDGEPDPWGMIVNPWYSTDGQLNPSGSAFTVPRDTFPKADPIEQEAVAGQAPINLVAYRPYTNDLGQGGLLTLRGDGQILGGWDSNAIPPRFVRAARDLAGAQKVLGLSDTPSAARYEVLTAKLRNPAGEFVAPTTETIEAAAVAMTRDAAQPQVVGFDPASSEAASAPAAYPLTLPVYAAARVDITDAEMRKDYASFVRYAVGDGQEPGEALGQLPRGYAPLPESWREQALLAATAIETGRVGTPTVPPAAPPSAAAPTIVNPPSTGGAGPAAAAVPAPASAASGVVEETAAEGQATTVLSGPPSAADAEFAAYGAVVPGSAAAGLAAVGASLFFSRRRSV